MCLYVSDDNLQLTYDPREPTSLPPLSVQIPGKFLLFVPLVTVWYDVFIDEFSDVGTETNV